MDVQLKELIDKIKNDGVKNAEESADRIIAEAKTQADTILREAREDADKIRETAKADAEKSERSGREALRQAGRDLVITVKSEIEALFSRVLKAETADVLKSDMLSELVSTAVKSLAESEGTDLNVLISEKSFAAVEAALVSKLASEISAGVEIKPFKGLDAGFRVSMKDGSAFYDFSDSEIAAMLGRSLNPRLADLLSE